MKQPKLSNERVLPVDAGNVAIELADGSIATVDLYDKNSQVDLTWSRHIILNPQSRWDVMSAFHKSLRGNCFNLALNWGRLFALKSSPHVVLKYLKKIIFEETRNLDLFFRLSGGTLGYEEAIMLFSGSMKKWEILYYQDHFDNWNKGYLRFITRKKNGYIFDYSTIDVLLDQITNEIQIYELNYFLQERKDQDDIFFELLKVKFPNNQLLQKFINARTGDSSSLYFRMVSLELAFCVWKEDANSYHPIPEKTSFYIPAKRVWYFDIHTKSAKKLITQNYNHLRPGKNYQFHSLDLRLSGMLLGIAFRFRVKRPLEYLWMEVELSDTDWQELVEHEKRFYDV